MQNDEFDTSLQHLLDEIKISIKNMSRSIAHVAPLIVLLIIVILGFIAGINIIFLSLMLFVATTTLLHFFNRNILRIVKQFTYLQIKTELTKQFNSHKLLWLGCLSGGFILLVIYAFILTRGVCAHKADQAYHLDNWNDVIRYSDYVLFPSDDIKSKRIVAFDKIKFISAKALYTDRKVKAALFHADSCNLPEARQFTTCVRDTIKSIDRLMFVLKNLVQSDINLDSIDQILSTINDNPDSRKFIIEYYPNVKKTFDSYSDYTQTLYLYQKKLNNLKADLDGTKSFLKSSQKTEGDLYKQGIRYRRFTIIGVVTTADDDIDGSKSLENTANLAIMDNYSKVALVDKEGGKIPMGCYMKSYSFMVKPLGKKYFLSLGANGWCRVGQGEAFEIVSDDENPTEIHKSIKENNQEILRLEKSISELSAKLKIEKRPIISSMIANLRISLK